MSRENTVLVYGDSIMSSCRDYLGWFYGARGLTMDFRPFPGVGVCDQLEAMRTAPLARVVVLAHIGNMITACTQGRGTQEQVYREDLDKAAKIFKDRGQRALFCSAPGRVGTYECENVVAHATKDAAAKYGHTYHDAAHSLANSDCLYQWWLPCEPHDHDLGWCWNGATKVRDDDTVHLTQPGQFRFANSIVNATP